MKRARGFSLKRHSLMERNKNCNLVTVISHICGINAQSARAAYISLWSRVRNFKRTQYDDALYKDRRLVRTWLMRGTVHTVPASEYPTYQKALESYQVARREKNEYDLEKMGFGLDPGSRTKLEERIVELLRNDNLTVNELLEKSGSILEGLSEKGRRWRVVHAVRLLSNKGIICHAEHTGPWYHFKENRFTTLERWLGGMKLGEIDEVEARARLAIKYFAGYGPATIADFAYWSGLKSADAKRAFEMIKPKLVEVKVDGASNWLLAQDSDILVDTKEDSDYPVRFLPEFDSLIMGHKDKSRILADERRQKVFLRLADVAPVFFFEGKVAGTWKHKISDKTYELEPFEKLGKKEQTSVDEEFSRLREFMEGE
ncbi:AlkZ family DNA glycosylase [candidate division WOR-3 bacterium]|nr:AlkZ family DNA glycosylase [candidate division WOR-3 bacterium]